MSWDTQTGYDPSAFYTSGSDQKGHTAQFGVRVPPKVARQVNELVSSEKFPAYKTASDVFRDAIVHLVAKRADQVEDRKMMKEISLVSQRMKMEGAVESLREMRATMQSAKTALMAYYNGGDKMGLQEQIYSVKETVLLLEEPYKGELEKVIDEYVGKLERMEEE